MKLTSAALLAAALLLTGPATAQTNQPVLDESETDIEIINGIPVNPELKALLMQQEEALSVQELIDLSNKVLADQQEEAARKKIDDRSWMGNDPLGHLEGEMQVLVMDIQERDTAEKTQQRGDDVVRKMDSLIALLEEASSTCKSCSGSGPGSGNGNGPAKGNNPAQDSTLAAGPGGSGDLSAKGQGNNRFEDLDPAQREAILRAQQDQQGLPTEYDALLAEYFARLASEKALDAPDASEDE